MKPWLRTVLKVVIKAATMCTGIVVPKYDMPVGDKGHQAGWDIQDIREDRQNQKHAA